MAPTHAQSKKESKKQVNGSNVGVKSKGDGASNKSSNGGSQNSISYNKKESAILGGGHEEVPINWNYEQLSDEVKQQIDFNKINGKSLSEGIIKEYRIEINQCNSVETCKGVLSFLHTEKGIISFEYLGGHLVTIRVDLLMKSEKLKEILSNKSLDFSFIHENYLIQGTQK